MQTALILVAAVMGLLVLMIFFGFAWFRYVTRPRRDDDGGFAYVYIDDAGAARELTRYEREVFEEHFHPNDGDRPYVKLRYESRTPDGRLRGFLKRIQVPQHIQIEPAPPVEELPPASTWSWKDGQFS